MKTSSCWCAAVVVSLVAATAACGGGTATPDRSVSTGQTPPDTTNTGTTNTGTTNTGAVRPDDGSGDASRFAAAAAVLALPVDEQHARVASDGVALQAEIATLSGLEAALGGPEAARSALQEAWNPVLSDIAATDAASLATGFRRSAPTGPNISEGMYGGYRLVGGVALGLVRESNTTTEPQQGSNPSGTTSAIVSVEKVAFDSSVMFEKDGLTTKLTTKAQVLPCPSPTGEFEASATIEVAVTKDGVGQTATFDAAVIGQVDDNANVSRFDLEGRMQYGRFGGGAGEFVDVTVLTAFDGPSTARVNRQGGKVSKSLMSDAQNYAALYSLLVGGILKIAAEEGLESGRCVKLNITPSIGPSGLAPSEEVSVLAEPRSKIDGAKTAGNVTATLSAGGATVDPNGSPVPADATFNYVAPDEVNKTGTVSFESRSNRGVGKAEITFETGGKASFQVVGGLEDFQVSEVVCDVMEPFTLTSGIGVMQLSGGLSGTYEFNGDFAAHYTGTYQIDLPNGPDQPGTMTGGGSGTIAGGYGSGSENYVLTPVKC